ncbi:MAG: hypothetical protein A4E64_00396 [Syntrophorhabdus sp. PtaU1.Bin058]|nr:MAG: hypothetical protein A4E64_00396 [Syntrophorhabdus sp. PtaU1.Bin058]
MSNFYPVGTPKITNLIIDQILRFIPGPAGDEKIRRRGYCL